jgi:hypothetical protein
VSARQRRDDLIELAGRQWRQARVLTKATRARCDAGPLAVDREAWSSTVTGRMQAWIARERDDRRPLQSWVKASIADREKRYVRAFLVEEDGSLINERPGWRATTISIAHGGNEILRIGQMELLWHARVVSRP